MTDSFVIEPLASHHDRIAFSCGINALDRYLQTQAGQDIRRRISNCFVAVAPNTSIIAGYYTLAAASIPVTDLPPEETKRLPKYPVLPAAIVGRLAVDSRYTRRSLEHGPIKLNRTMLSIHWFAAQSYGEPVPTSPDCALGSALLFDAMQRAMRADPAVYAVVVDAKDEVAADFYRHLGFRAFSSRRMSFFLPLATANKLRNL